MVVLLCSIAAALLLLPPLELIEFIHSVDATLTIRANLYFFTNHGYFDVQSKWLPLLHMWSLSVEEQFYMVYPLLLFVTWRFSKFKLHHIIALGMAMSFLYAIYRSEHGAGQIYYLVFPRVWELLLGGILIAYPFPRLESQRLAECLTGTGVVLICLSIAFISPALPYLSVVMAAPCLGAAMIIYGNTGRQTTVGRLLSTKPFVFVGLISYSLYLWHWPLIAFYGRSILDTPPPVAMAAIVILSFALATLSWRYVERPFRSMRNGINRRELIRAIAAAACIVGGLVLTIRLTHGLPQRYSPAIAHLDSRQKDFEQERREIYREKTCFITDGDWHSQYRSDLCLTPDPKANNAILWGDSHAAHLAYGIEKAGRATNLHLMQATLGACSPFAGNHSPGSPEGCDQFNSYVMSKIHAPIGAVILSMRWNQDPPIAALAPLQATVRALLARGVKVVVLGPSVTYRIPEPQILEKYVTTKDLKYLDSRKYLDQQSLELDRNLKSVFGRMAGVTYISIYDATCPADRCPMTAGGDTLEFDTAHLTARGSELVAARIWPRLAPAIGVPVQPRG